MFWSLGSPRHFSCLKKFMSLVVPVGGCHKSVIIQGSHLRSRFSCGRTSMIENKRVCNGSIYPCTHTEEYFVHTDGKTVYLWYHTSLTHSLTNMSVWTTTPSDPLLGPVTHRWYFIQIYYWSRHWILEGIKFSCIYRNWHISGPLTLIFFVLYNHDVSCISSYFAPEFDNMIIPYLHICIVFSIYYFQQSLYTFIRRRVSFRCFLEARRIWWLDMLFIMTHTLSLIRDYLDREQIFWFWCEIIVLYNKFINTWYEIFFIHSTENLHSFCRIGHFPLRPIYVSTNYDPLHFGVIDIVRVLIMILRISVNNCLACIVFHFTPNFLLLSDAWNTSKLRK